VFAVSAIPLSLYSGGCRTAAWLHAAPGHGGTVPGTLIPFALLHHRILLNVGWYTDNSSVDYDGRHIVAMPNHLTHLDSRVKSFGRSPVLGVPTAHSFLVYGHLTSLFISLKAWIPTLNMPFWFIIVRLVLLRDNALSCFAVRIYRVTLAWNTGLRGIGR